MTTGATRDEVLAWMRETGNGPAAAARHFGLHLSRVKMWRHRTPDADVTTAGNVTASVTVETPAVSAATAKPAKSGEAVTETSRPSRARTAPAAALGPELRKDLRESVKHAAKFLAEAPNDDTDWQQRAHAARALEILLARVPDLMTFDERTNPQTTEATARDAEIGGVFGAPPATVTVLDGGRVAAKA